MTSRPPTDTRKQQARFNRTLGLMVLFVLVVVGGGLITLFYGPQAGLLGVVCLFAGAATIGLIWLIYTLIGRWANAE
jgi:hypothetical protein